MSHTARPAPALGDAAPELLHEMEARLAAVAAEVAQMHSHVVALRMAVAPPPPPPLPWKTWLRHHAKEVLGLKVTLGKLEFNRPPRPLTVPARYHRAPRPANPPTISIATPSFNQGPFLEHTIRSVLTQDYPKLEYVVQDGGSTDSTGEVLDRYRPRLFRSESRKDNGQSHAINLGLAGTTGEVMAYLNSDDLLLPGALHTVGRFFERNPDVDVVYGHRVLIDGTGLEIGRWVIPPHDAEVLKWADYVPQETLFWRRRIWDKVGGIDESFRFAMDWDLLLRFQEAGAKFYRIPRFLGAFRIHDASKTMTVVNTQGEMEMARLRQRSLGRLPGPMEIKNRTRRYLGWHVFYNRMYELGLFRY